MYSELSLESFHFLEGCLLFFERVSANLWLGACNFLGGCLLFFERVSAIFCGQLAD